MEKIRYVLRQGFTAIAVVMMLGMAPTPALAADATTSSTTDTSTSTNPGNGPTGSAASTFTYNASTGLWENDYYTYNPSTKETVPKVPPEYTYNTATGLWDAQMWVFIASHNQYEQTTVSVSTPPPGAITHGGPAPATDVTTPTPDASVPAADSTTTSGSGQTTGTDSSALPVNTPENLAASNTSGSDSSTNSNGSTNTSDQTTNNGTTVGMGNTITSTSASGSAAVLNNNNIGTVATGDASAIANVVNMLQSQASFSGTGLATFTKNIQGDVSGDLIIDPASLMQPASANQSDLSNATLNNKTTGTIANDILLNATSGNGTANNNNNVGSVTTGNANAVADVVNMINSIVAANQSFMGVINIYGDYTGNILMPADSLNALLASAGPAPATATGVTGTVNNDLTASVANNVDLSAKTGSATAGDNNNVGSVTTGNGLTNLTILNLTNHQITAANSLLVFVNVMGTWVGLIMDAPAGATSAALGGGVTNNALLANATSTMNNTGTYGITNNITANAASGNATATNNNNVGTVASGNATASANIANLINSSLGLSNWFGVLFINVFGSWHGNFGVVKPPVVPPITSGLAGPASGAASAIKDVRVFAFVPKPASQQSGGHTSGHSTNLTLAPMGHMDMTDTNGPTGGKADTVQTTSAVLGTVDAGAVKPHQTTASQPGSNKLSLSVILIGLGAAGFAFVAAERIRNALRARHLTK